MATICSSVFGHLRDPKFGFVLEVAADRVSKVAYRVVHKFCRDSGVAFPDTEHGVKVKLKEQGLLFPAESGREPFFYQLPIEGRPRVLRISNFLTDDKEPSS